MLIFDFCGGIIFADEKSSTILDSYESIQITYIAIDITTIIVDKIDHPTIYGERIDIGANAVHIHQ